MGTAETALAAVDAAFWAWEASANMANVLAINNFFIMEFFLGSFIVRKPSDNDNRTAVTIHEQAQTNCTQCYNGAMPIQITVAFEPENNIAYFDIDTSAMTKVDGVTYPLSNAFPNLNDEEMDNLFALDEDQRTTRVTEKMSEWRHLARRIQHNMKSGHLWDISAEDCKVQWKDTDGIGYDNPNDIPAPADVVHTLGTTAINDFVRVGDPCYDWKESEDTHLPVLPGQWTFELTARDDAKDGMANGHRPARMVAYNADIGPVDIEALLSSAKPHAICGVDSATCGFLFDEPVPKSSTAAKDKWYETIIDGVHDKDNKGPNATFAPDLHAVIASTFYGDGGYPMFVQRNEQGQAIAVVLVTDHGDPSLKNNPNIEHDYDDLDEDGPGY